MTTAWTAATAGIAAALAVLAGAAGEPVQRDDALVLVACAPGYPGTTESAQPTMDALAALLAQAAGWSPGAVVGEYREREEEGVRRIRDSAALAVVPLPFFLLHADELDLRPLAQTVAPDGESTQAWSLVAGAGSVTAVEAMADWEVTGIPGYAPEFVRGVLLPALPDSATVSFASRILAALRRAAAGERVAVLLDAEQTAALPSLPYAASLAVIARSQPVIAALVVAVGDRLGQDQREQLRLALQRVHREPGSADVLTTLRVQRLVAVDEQLLARLRGADRPSTR